MKAAATSTCDPATVNAFPGVGDEIGSWKAYDVYLLYFAVAAQ